MNNKMQGKFIVWAKRSHDLPAKVSVGANIYLNAQISVRPKNKMFGRFDIIERPVDVYELTVTKDSTIREQIPTLNYGQDIAMLVGNSDGEKFRSILSFDLSSLPVGLNFNDFKYAKIHLKNNFIRNTVNVSLFVSEQDWSEKDVTWSNQPRSGLKIGDYSISPDAEETVLDISSFFQKWLNGDIPNYGLFIFASDENNSPIVQFGTKESPTPPVLKVGYYKVIPNGGISKLPVSITVRATDFSNLKSKIHVNSQNRSENLPSLLVIHKNKQTAEILSSLTVKVLRESKMASKLLIETKQNDSILSSKITVKENADLFSNLVIENKNARTTLSSTITVRVKGSNLLASTFAIEKKEVKQLLASQMRVKFRENLPSTLEITKKRDFSNLRASISVTGHSLLASKIIIPFKKELKSKIYVRHKSEIRATLQVNSQFLNAQLKVRGFSESNLKSSITVRVKRISDLHSRIILVNAGEESNFGFIFII